MPNRTFWGFRVVDPNEWVPEHLSRQILYLRSVLPSTRLGGVRCASSPGCRCPQEDALVGILGRILRRSALIAGGDGPGYREVELATLEDPQVGVVLVDWSHALTGTVDWSTPTDPVSDSIDHMILSIPLPHRQWVVSACRLTGVTPRPGAMPILDTVAHLVATGTVPHGGCPMSCWRAPYLG